MGTKYVINKLRGDCEGDDVCPAIHEIVGEPEVRYVQGWIITDPGKLAAFGVPPGETVVAVPASLIPEVR